MDLAQHHKDRFEVSCTGNGIKDKMFFQSLGAGGGPSQANVDQSGVHRQSVQHTSDGGGGG